MVVFPLVPVTAIIGIRADLPGGYSISITGAATLRGKPSLGAKCILKPGAALTSNTTPPFSVNGSVRFLAIMSIPQISNPITRDMRSQVKIFCG
ncbi:hypothetical protein D9M68_738170 [compost metagenome]